MLHGVSIAGRSQTATPTAWHALIVTVTEAGLSYASNETFDSDAMGNPGLRKIRLLLL